MNDSNGILIVGGYGQVGLLIAKDLAKLGHSSIRIGGRSAQKAESAAIELRCGSAQIDVGRPETWDAALAGIRMVIVCVDQHTIDFVRHVLERGIVYLDITAGDNFLPTPKA